MVRPNRLKTSVTIARGSWTGGRAQRTSQCGQYRTVAHSRDLERKALIDLDVGALYEMGSHPYILLHFARAVEVDFNGIPFPEFDRAYKVAVTPHGYPNFAT